MFSQRKSLIFNRSIAFVMLQSCVSLTNISIIWTLTWIVSKSRYDVCIMGSANDGSISMNNPQKAKKSFYCLSHPSPSLNRLGTMLLWELLLSCTDTHIISPFLIHTLQIQISKASE